MSSSLAHIASEPAYARLLEAIPDAAIVVNRAGEIVLANLLAGAMFGYERGELRGLALAALVPAGAQEEHARDVARYFANPRTRPLGMGLKLAGRRRDGIEFPVDILLSPLGEGDETLVLGVMRDRPATDWSQQALLASDQRYRSLFENILDGVAYCRMVFDEAQQPRDFIFLEVNEAFQQLTGLEQAAGQRASEVWPELAEANAEVLAAFGRVALTGQPERFEARLGPLGGRWHAIAVYTIEQGYFVTVLADISERKRAEEALRDSERLLQESQVIAGLGSYVLDFATGLWSSSEVLDQIFGIGADYVRSVEGWANVVHPAERQQMIDYFANEVVAQRGRFDKEYRIIRPSDRAERWVHGVGELTLDDHNRIVKMLGTIMDITDRRRAEISLAEERNLLRTLIDNVPDFMYAKDADSRFTLVNQASARSLGHPPEEIVGKTDRELHPPELAAQFLADEQAVLRSGEPLVDREEMMYENGRERWQLTTTVPLRDGAGRVTGIVGISRNIDSRREAEQELQQRLAELEAVNQISKAVRAAQTLDEMLPMWLDVSLALLRANGGSVWLYNPEADELRPAVLRGWKEAAGTGPVPAQKPGTDVVGHVYLTGQPYVSADFQQDPHMAPGLGPRLPPGGGASIPIRVGDQIIGAFVVNTPPGRALTAAELHLLGTLSEIAGSAIHRMRLFEQTEQRLNQITTLRAIDVAITASLDVRVTLEVFLEQVTQQLGVHAADVLLMEADSRTLHYAAGRGFRSHDFEQVRQRLGEGRAGRVALERRLQIVTGPSAGEPPGRRTGMLQVEDFVCYVGMPLLAKGQVLGVLELFHRAPLQTNAEWLQFLETLAGQAAIAIENAQLFDSLQQANQKLVLAYDATIEGWSAALDLRDHETEGHTQRVTDVTEQLARALGLSELVHIRRGALLHDIGKMGIPDAILLKPGPLTAEEWVIMRQHPTFAYRLLAPISFLRPALDIPYCHHEKWDGTGYPRGLSGEQIPLAARVFAVADVWDALCSHRPYRAAWPADRVREHIRSLAGSHFDPQVVGVALESGIFQREYP